jgi:anti-sigma factor RsiW
MSDLGERLSAYLDGELPTAEADDLARQLATDPALRAEFEALQSANAAAIADFDALLRAPLPLGLVRAVRDADAPALAAPDTPPRARWGLVAASIGILAIGAAGGYLAGRPSPGDTARDWIADVGAYHAVYARQTRHLAEVPASESDHIETWLADQTGVPVRIPDLAARGLTFEGGRLLVAGGQPVGQLMYRDAGGAVLALCFIASDKPATDAATPRDLDGFDALVWGEDGARFILIAPEDYPALGEIAETVRAI